MPNTVEHVNKIQTLASNVEKIIRGKTAQIKKILTCLFAGGHVLLEDKPGLGKTATAKALAFSIHGNEAEKAATGASPHRDGVALFRRIQFTPDLLPLDLLGTYIFNDATKEFVFHKGPLFANIILADEINRASPKVQSALLECMAEKQITIADRTHVFEHLFFIIATQNPVEMEGTYPLPAAQLDRFFMKLEMGYVDGEVELEIYNNYRQINNVTDTIRPVLGTAEVLDIQKGVEEVYLHQEITKAVQRLAHETRHHPEIRLGASTRAGITLLRCLRSFALVHGRDYVVEDDLKQIALPVLQHRLIFSSSHAAETVLPELVQNEIDRLTNLSVSFFTR